MSSRTTDCLVQPLDITGDKASNRAGVLGGLAVFGYCIPDLSPLWSTPGPMEGWKGGGGMRVHICGPTTQVPTSVHLWADVHSVEIREGERGWGGMNIHRLEVRPSVDGTKSEWKL